jgi:hypothetical protein
MKSHRRAWIWRLILGTLLFLLLILGLDVWLEAFFFTPAHPASFPEVEKRIQNAVPPGSSRVQIEDWLDSQQIEHGYAQSRPFDDGLPYQMRTGLQEKDYDGVVMVIIRDTSQSFFVRGDICIRFLIDHEQRCAKCFVYWVGTGP